MYDAVIVGARVAGSATARLLAARGLRVLVVDRATFPSDTVSTHCIDPLGIQLLDNWGLFDAVLATGAPRIRQFVLTIGDFELPGEPSGDGVTAPRRTVLDKLFVDVARDAGAEVREGVKVTELLRDGDGRVTGIRCVDRDGTTSDEMATIVVGADGAHSFVARQVDAETYGTRQGQGSGYYSYWSGTGLTAVELCFSPAVFAGVFPTNDDAVCVFGGRVSESFVEEASKDRDGAVVAAVREASPRVGEAIANGKREETFVKWKAEPGFFRVPYGPGWALVGDAGFHIDPVTGRGIGHAFRDAQLLADAIAGSDGTIDERLASYHRVRDEMSTEMYRVTQDIAELGGTNEDLLGLFGALQVESERLCDIAAGWAQVPSPTAAGAAATS